MIFFTKGKLFFSSILFLLLVGCTAVPEKNNPNSPPQQAPRKVIAYLGSDVGWFEDKGVIYKDFSVSGLRVRISTAKDVQSRCISGEWRRIEIDGPINKDTSFVIDKALSEVQPCIMQNGRKLVVDVYMNSKGGTLDDGFLIGRVLRKHSAAVVLASNQVCASACAVAYLGGGYRNMSDNAQLIFHSPYIKKFDYGYESIKCADEKSAKPLLDYYQEMLGSNVAKKLFERTMDYCSKSEGWTLDTGAAEFFGLLKK
jgi:ATP-dependent protease ClpP protease subunit